MAFEYDISQEKLDELGLTYLMGDIVPNQAENIKAIIQLTRLTKWRPKNILIELKMYRELVPVLLKGHRAMYEGLMRSIREKERLVAVDADNKRRKWTPDEDAMLIEAVCEPDTNIHMLSSQFGRTPSAIQSRISHLVGVKRLSRKVAGRFVGTIDGEETTANIDGTVCVC